MHLGEVRAQKPSFNYILMEQFVPRGDADILS